MHAISPSCSLMSDIGGKALTFDSDCFINWPSAGGHRLSLKHVSYNLGREKKSGGNACQKWFHTNGTDCKNNASDLDAACKGNTFFCR